jgi:hypothetical protein
MTASSKAAIAPEARIQAASRPAILANVAAAVNE